MTDVIQPSLTSGEITPDLYGRTDMDVFYTGVAQAKNCFVDYHGGLKRRPGMEVIDNINASSRLVPFSFSSNQTYMLVFYAGGIQIVKDGAFLYDGGSRVTVATSYTSAQVAVLTYTQSADVLTIFNSDHPINELRRYAENDWQLVEVETDNGPFERVNTDKEITIYASAEEGTVTLTASSSVFNANHVGKQIKLEQSSSGEITSWTQRSDTSVGDRTYYNGNYYICTKAVVYDGNAAQTGDTPPVHEDGEYWDGPNKNIADDNRNRIIGVRWKYMHNGEGYATIQSVESGTSCTAIVTKRIPDSCVGGNISDLTWTFVDQIDERSFTLSPLPTTTFADDISVTIDGISIPPKYSVFDAGFTVNLEAGTIKLTQDPSADGVTPVDVVVEQAETVRETYKWSFAAWRDDSGYPRCGTYYSQRLCMASTNDLPQTLWASVTDSFNNFRVSKIVLADDSLRFDVNSIQVNEILHMLPLSSLLMFTRGGVQSINQSSNDVLSAEEPPAVRMQSYHGCADLKPLIVGATGIYVQTGQQRVRDIGFDFSADAFIGTDLTVRAGHLFEDRQIVSWCFAEHPHNTVYVAFDDGKFAIFTYLKDQKIWGWTSAETDGSVTQFETVLENNRSVVYAAVTRQNGTYLERIGEANEKDQQLQFFVDSGLTYNGKSASSGTVTVTGTSYESSDTVTVSSSAGIFNVADIGKAVRIYTGDDDFVDLTILTFGSASSVTARCDGFVPADYRAVALSEFAITATTLSGLEHLNGQAVSVLADGSYYSDLAVSGGSLSLGFQAAIVTVGLPYETLIKTLDADYANAPGTYKNKRKIVPKIGVITNNTSTIKVSTNGVMYYEYEARDASNVTALPNRSNDVIEVNVDAEWSKNGAIYIKQDLPINIEVLAIIPTIELGG